jgi:hypothetical protein
VICTGENSSHWRGRVLFIAMLRRSALGHPAICFKGRHPARGRAKLGYALTSCDLARFGGPFSRYLSVKLLAQPIAMFDMPQLPVFELLQ